MKSTYRVKLDKAALDQNLRFVAYHVLHAHLEIDQAIRDRFVVDPVKRLILVTVMAATMQRFVQDRSVPSHERALRRMERHEAMPISRRSIALATGLPRETVRRQVQEMLDLGLLEVRLKGVLANVLLLDERSLTAIAALAEATTVLAQKLVELDVLTVADG
jgi:hypothetical protein